MFAHQKYKKQSKAIKTRKRTYILQQVSNISKRQCSPTRNIKKQSKAIKTRTRTYILQQVSNISKRQCSSTRNIKNRVKQLRLEHVHTFYNKYPTYLKGRNIKKQSKAIKTRTRTYILQQVSNISKRQCSPTRNIKKQSKAIKTRTRTYILQQVSNISKRQCSPTRNIKNRVKQLRLEHVHTFYNKCPTYLKGSVRPPEI